MEGGRNEEREKVIATEKMFKQIWTSCEKLREREKKRMMSDEVVVETPPTRRSNEDWTASLTKTIVTIKRPASDRKRERKREGADFHGNG